MVHLAGRFRWGHHCLDSRGVTMRAIAIFGVIAVAGAVVVSVPIKRANSQSPNDKARCLSISDVDERVDCLESLGGRTQTAPIPMRPTLPLEDRELDCRNPQDAPLCREYERDQAIRSGRPPSPAEPPTAQAPAQYGVPRPSFNCARPVTVIEQAICSDATLAQWDANMGQLYHQALAIQNNSPRLKGEQGRWIAQRNRNCSGINFSETKSCVLEMTKARVGGLAAVVAASGGNPNSSPESSAPVPNPPSSPVVPEKIVTTNPLTLPTGSSIAQVPILSSSSQQPSTQTVASKTSLPASAMPAAPDQVGNQTSPGEIAQGWLIGILIVGAALGAALIVRKSSRPCRACGLKVSTKAKICPHCGVHAPTHSTQELLVEPQQKRGIGSAIVWLTILGLIIIVIANGSSSDKSEKPKLHLEDDKPAAKQEIDPAQTAALDVAFAQTRACIRNNIPNAYQSGVYGFDQATAFFMKICFGPFSLANRQLGADESASATFFKVLVMQEISPQEWQRATEEFKRGLQK